MVITIGYDDGTKAVFNLPWEFKEGGVILNTQGMGT